jgi:hypothetical protein
MWMLAARKAGEKSKFGIDSILIALATNRSCDFKCGLEMFFWQDGGDIHKSTSASKFVFFRSNSRQHIAPDGCQNAIEVGCGEAMKQRRSYIGRGLECRCDNRQASELFGRRQHGQQRQKPSL